MWGDIWCAPNVARLAPGFDTQHGPKSRVLERTRPIRQAMLVSVARLGAQRWTLPRPVALEAVSSSRCLVQLGVVQPLTRADDGFGESSVHGCSLRKTGCPMAGHSVPASSGGVQEASCGQPDRPLGVPISSSLCCYTKSPVPSSAWLASLQCLEGCLAQVVGSRVHIRRPINLCSGEVLNPSVGVLRQARIASSGSCLSSLAFCRRALHVPTVFWAFPLDWRYRGLAVLCSNFQVVAKLWNSWLANPGLLSVITTSGIPWWANWILSCWKTAWDVSVEIFGQFDQ